MLCYATVRYATPARIRRGGSLVEGVADGHRAEEEGDEQDEHEEGVGTGRSVRLLGRRTRL